MIAAVDWPAYNSSNVTRSLTTLGQVVSIAFLVVAALLYRYGRSAVGQLLASVIGVAGLVTVTLGMPLGLPSCTCSGSASISSSAPNT